MGSCTCYVTDEKTWTRYGSAVEPGSTWEPNPCCPEHFPVVAHTKTDPACVYYKETGPFRRYLNERGRGKACLICVPAYRPAP